MPLQQIPVLEPDWPARYDDLTIQQRPLHNAQVSLRCLPSDTHQGFTIDLSGSGDAEEYVLGKLEGGGTLQVLQPGWKRKFSPLAKIYATQNHVRLEAITAPCTVASGSSWFTVEPSIPRKTVTVLLRPDDLIRIGEDVLQVCFTTVSTKGTSSEGKVEVGSSIPELPDGSAERSGKGGKVQQQSFRSDSGLLEMVEETPASRQRFFDALGEECREDGLQSPGEEEIKRPLRRIASDSQLHGDTDSEHDGFVGAGHREPHVPLGSCVSYATAPSPEANKRTVVEARDSAESTQSELEPEQDTGKRTTDPATPLQPVQSNIQRTASKKRKSSPVQIDSGYASTRKRRASGVRAAEGARMTSRAGSRALESRESPPQSPLPALNSQPSIAFSSSTIKERAALMRFLKKQGCKVIDRLSSSSDVLVVGGPELKKTSKFLSALALGGPIVTEEWVVQSAQTGCLLDAADFVPQDPVREAAWSINLRSLLGHDRRSLLARYVVCFSPAAKKSYGAQWRDIEQLVTTLGASRVFSASAKQVGGINNNIKESKRSTSKGISKGTCEGTSEAASTTNEDEQMIFVGLEQGDADVRARTKVGLRSYAKDIVPSSVLRGWVDLEAAEFRVE